MTTSFPKGVLKAQDQGANRYRREAGARRGAEQTRESVSVSNSANRRMKLVSQHLY